MNDIYEHVLATVEHNTDNRVQGPTAKRPIVKRQASHKFDIAAVEAAIDELLHEGELEEPAPDELALPGDQ